MLRLTRHDLATGKGIATGLPAPLVGGMKLTSPEFPAAGQPGNDLELSYPLARGCVKLLEGDLARVELIGSDASPSGLHVILANGKSDCWVVPGDTADGKVLWFRGMPFVQLLNYNFGLCLGLWLMMNREHYPEFAAAVGTALAAKDGQGLPQALASMACEMTQAVQRILGGQDPMGLQAILLDREVPVGYDQVFTGGEVIQAALSDLDAFRRLTGADNAGAAPDTQASPGFVGDLVGKLIDCIRRGKHVLLTGPTATGKTLAVEEACLQMGAPLTVIRGCEGLEDRDLIGSTTLVTERGPNGEVASHTHFTYGPLPEAMLLGRKQYEKHLQAKAEKLDADPIPPSVLLVDEVNRLQLRFQNLLIGGMNVRTATKDYYLRIPDNNEEVTCPEGWFVIVAARNVGGAFVGTNPMDLALERRFYKKIQVNYLPVEEELKLVVTRTGLDEKLARVLVKVAADTRYQLSQLKAPLDTDTLLKWAEELAYLKDCAAINDQVLLSTARDVVFDVVLERTERGGPDPAGEAVLMDNISENWRDCKSL